MSRGIKLERVYPRVEKEMTERGISTLRLSNAIGVDHHTLYAKFSGQSEIKLWEAIAIKKALGCDMPIETLFEKGE